MDKKDNLDYGDKSIYYNLKEFHERNLGELYSYQDFETDGIREFKSANGKVRPLKNYEKNRLSNELMKILLKDAKIPEKLSEINGYITLNPIIDYYESVIKLFKGLLEVDNGITLEINEIIRKMIMDSYSSEEIKLGLILAPMCKLENIEEILEVFSIHNEYLFYVIKSYEYIGGFNNVIFNASKKAKGYGKVFCVMNLRPTTDEIKKWMIEEGSNNSVGVTELLSYSMLSLELLDYLETTEFDEEKIEIIAKSFSLLFSDYGLDEIKDGKEVCNKLLEIIDKVGGGIYSLYVVISIIYSIESIVIDDYKTKRNSGSFKIDDEYKDMAEACKKICKKDIWHEVIAKQISNIEIESSVLISSCEKTKYKLIKTEFEMILKRDYTNPLLYKYAFSMGNKSIKKSAMKIGLQKLPMTKILTGQDELKIDDLSYEDIAQICFFILIKYAQYDDCKDKYKDINLQALRASLIETRIQAAINLQRFTGEFDSLDKEIINDAIDTEMVKNIRRSINSLLIKTQNKEKRYVEVYDNMHIDAHVKDVYLININIFGTNFVDMSEIYNKLTEGDMLYLKRDIRNSEDINAIEIITTEGYVMGYVPKENNLILKNLMDKGKYIYGKIKEISDDYNHINIELYLSYKDIIEEITSTLSLLSRGKELYLQ